MSYCRDCGSEIGATDDFCVECGASLETQDAEAVYGEQSAAGADEADADSARGSTRAPAETAPAETAPAETAPAETAGDGGHSGGATEPRSGTGAAERAPVEPETGTGLDSNVAGALAYVMALLTGVLFFVLEPDDEFVRFHAAQSIVATVAMFAVSIAFVVVQTVISFVPVVGGLFAALFGLVWIAFWLAGLALWGLLMYRAYQGERWRIPVLGGVAENLAG